MKKILCVILFMVSCTNVTSPVKNQQSNSSKEAVILTYSQSVRDSVIASQPCPLGTFCRTIICPGSCDSVKNESMRRFVLNEMDTHSVVLLSSIGFNDTPIGNDDGGGTYQHAISKFPFAYTSTLYNGKDSARLQVDSIDGSSNVFLKLKNKQFKLNRGDSLVLTDTVYGGDPPCQRRIIITKTLKNAGLDSLPNDRYRSYF